jgi:hypothetical protein
VIDWGTSSDLRKSMHLNIALVGVHFVPHDWMCGVEILCLISF